MTRDERIVLSKQLLSLYEYNDRLEQALRYIHEAETVSVLELKINKLDTPNLDELRVFDDEGRVIDWEGFPKELKRRPFMIFPGARLETPRKFELEVDFQLSSAFLLNLLTYLHKQVNHAIDELQEKLHGHKDKF